jgi:gamma-glutamyltranspeptidase/glutathione hydrolase
MTSKDVLCAFAGVAGLIALSGCAERLGLEPATPQSAAIVVGDEPYAVRAAAGVMAQGGNAVDAATAMYFALSVTYPVAAGLGGGGICLIHDPATSRNEEFDFLARDAAGGGAFAVPGNVQGFAAVHAAFGLLPWPRVVSASEGFAATGFPISRALATRLAASENVIRLDAGLAAEFLDESGQVKPPGTNVANAELANTLGAIRIHGPGGFYTKDVGAQIVAYSTVQGGAIVAPELAAYRATRAAPQSIQFDGQTVFMPRQDTGAGAFAGALFGRLSRAVAATDPASNTEAAVVDATKSTLSEFNVTDLPNDLGSTGFAATDTSGQAIACAVTMNGPFGSGHTAQGTGVTLAKEPASGQAGLAAAFLIPVVATDGDGRMILAGAGAGGPIGTASIADALARLSKGEVVTPRGKASASGLALYDTVNAVVCQEGSCSALADANTNGLSASPGR